MNSGYFIFDGLDTRTLTGVSVFPVSLDDAPARDFQVIQVPGRIGAVILDNEKYNNVERSYYVLIQDNFETTYRNLRGFLLSRTNYCKLQDSWFPDEYYMAYVNQMIKPKLTDDRGTGKFVVTFSRKPQRYLTSGETPIDATATHSSSSSVVDYDDTVLSSPTYFPAKPLLVYTFTTSATFTNRYLYLGYTSLRNVDSSKPRPQTNYINYLYLDTMDDDVPLSTYIDNTMEIAIDTESKSAYVVGTNTYLNNLLVVSSSAATTVSGNRVYKNIDEFNIIPSLDAGWQYVYHAQKYPNTQSGPSMNISIYSRWYNI